MRLSAITLMFVLGLWVLPGCGGNAPAEKKTTAKAETDSASARQTSNKKTILFFGNSLSAGYGLDDPKQAFAGLVQSRLDSLGLPWNVVNAGVSGETTAGGEGRIDWILKQPIDVFVLELGGNDGLRGIPVAETRENLQTIMDKVRSAYPQVKIVLAGMMVPPNMGPDYGKEFQKIYPELAAKNKVTLIPFLLEGVGGEPSLNLPDGIHPTPEGHRIVMETVWKALQPLL
jgi:acyl-CoA thioesterase-1